MLYTRYQQTDNPALGLFVGVTGNFVLRDLAEQWDAELADAAWHFDHLVRPYVENRPETMRFAFTPVGLATFERELSLRFAITEQSFVAVDIDPSAVDILYEDAHQIAYVEKS